MVVRITRKETREDDLTGYVGDDVRPFSFEVDGIIYTMDACLETREEIRQRLKDLMQVAHSRVDPSGHDTKAIREWAKKKGIPLQELGRIPDAVIRAYLEEHP